MSEHRSRMATPRRLATTSVSPLPGMKPSGTPGRILEEALKLFAEQGYAGASIRNVATATGITPAGIYVHFASKEHLLAELCRVGHEAHHQALRKALQAVDGSPRARATAYVRAHVEFHARYPMLAVVANSELHMLSEALGGATFAARHQSEQLLEDIVRSGVDSGLFRVQRPWVAVAAIGGMGLRVGYWYSLDSDMTPAQVADEYVMFALRLLGADEPPNSQSGGA